jgi:hypothetical protein
MKLPVVAVLGAVLLVVTSCAQPQASAVGCAQAIEVVRRGEPASEQERAWSTLPGCGTTGAVAARDAWKSLRSVSDSARIARAYTGVRSFRDSSVLGAARTLLLDSAATAEARVSSAMLVVAQVIAHADPDYHVFSTTGPHDACVIASVTDRSPRDGAPLPSDASALAESTALRVIASASAPQSVRNAARCLYDAVEGDVVLAGRTPAPSVAEHVSESAGRLDTVRVRQVGYTHPRARRSSRARMRQRVDSIRGVVGRGGECATSQPYLETNAGRRIGLRGSSDVVSQATGREVVVFGRRTTSPAHSLNLSYPLFTVDSFFVRADGGTRVHDGVLRRGPRGDVLEMRDGRRLPVANLPSALGKANGMRVWIAEPLGTPTIAGMIDPRFRKDCTE